MPTFYIQQRLREMGKRLYTQPIKPFMEVSRLALIVFAIISLDPDNTPVEMAAGMFQLWLAYRIRSNIFDAGQQGPH